MNKKTKKLHDRPSKTAKSKDIDYREQSETKEESGESEEESSNEDKGFVCLKCMPMVLKRSSTAIITKWTARKMIMLQKKMIASNKKIIAPDTDIETRETNAAKTTPEKERMTKSMIIVVKNVVSQSPIKVVNLGDISRKSSNGVSNTSKDAQVIASGLRDKLTMLEVLMNRIACDLEKAIQQHPGDKHIESIKLQWNEKLLKRESEMKKDKERPCEQIFEVDRELASVLPTNDIPSFDLGIMPTPLDVNINADKEDVSNQDPMLENVPLTFTRISVKLGLPPKREKEQESTTTASTTTASTTVKFLELIEVVSTTVKEQSSDLLANDAPSFDLGLTPTPPYVNLDTDTERKRKDLPMIEYEHVKKNAKEPGPTNTRTAFDVVPLSFAKPNATLVTPAIERKRKDFDKENISKEANDKEH
nr:hypothetical protein [Tanacetum cinerariifolium]